ncbi:acyltransferase [bacterium 1xD8-48]|nr:acyltransferase [bacterium 1xD8-48]
MTSFYTESELSQIGFKSYGRNVFLSRKASIYGAENIEIGNNVRIDDFTLISGNVKIGNWIHIAAYSAFYAGKYQIIMDDFVTISSRNIVYAESDDYSGASLSTPFADKDFRHTYGDDVILGKHVLLGTNCTILPGVNLQEGVSVGAMSLVTQNLEAWGVYAGIPAKRIKERNRAILELEKNFLAQQDKDKCYII